MRHPSWSRTRLEHFNEYIEGADAIEIYNHECEIVCGQGFGETYFETALWGGKRVWAVAADDMHRVHGLTGGFVMCKAESLTKENIVNALISGSFYASTGAYIDDFYVEDGVAYVSCPGSKADLHIRRYVPRHGRERSEGQAYKSKLEIPKHGRPLPICSLQGGNRRRCSFFAAHLAGGLIKTHTAGAAIT